LSFGLLQSSQALIGLILPTFVFFSLSRRLTIGTHRILVFWCAKLKSEMTLAVLRKVWLPCSSIGPVSAITDLFLFAISSDEDEKQEENDESSDAIEVC
jgi:hypothetical protein